MGGWWTFDEVIEKKKAMLILESQEEAYVEALREQEQAQKDVAAAQADLVEKQKEIDALWEEMQQAKRVALSSYIVYSKPPALWLA